MRNYEQELENRVAFIRQLLKESGCEGIVYGNSGGKDSALVGILCKKACGNTVGILLPCATTQNYGSDTDDAIRVAEQYGIAYRTVDLSETRGALVAALEKAGVELNNAAVSNIAPRLRMTALYAVAAAEHRLVAGTGNRSEAFMGYGAAGGCRSRHQPRRRADAGRAGGRGPRCGAHPQPQCGREPSVFQCDGAAEGRCCRGH